MSEIECYGCNGDMFTSDHGHWVLRNDHTAIVAKLEQARDEARSYGAHAGSCRVELEKQLAEKSAELDRQRDQLVDAAIKLSEAQAGLVSCQRARRAAEAENLTLAAQVSRMRDAMLGYVREIGVEHKRQCPEDDTCDCPHIVALNEAITLEQSATERFVRAAIELADYALEDGARDCEPGIEYRQAKAAMEGDKE